MDVWHPLWKGFESVRRGELAEKRMSLLLFYPSTLDVSGWQVIISYRKIQDGWPTFCFVL